MNELLALAVALYGLNWFSGLGLLATFVIGLMGAAALLVAQRAFWRDTSPRT